MIFSDRQEAGALLADEISKLKLDFKNVIVAAVPRGGIVVGAAVAARLSVPLTALVVKKLGAPSNPELAIGAVASHGAPVLDRWMISELGVSGDFLQKEIRTKKKEAAAREKFLGTTPSEEEFRGKTVIVTDDGLATGQTAKAAAKIIRRYKVSRLILAVPCATPATVNLLKDDFDQIVCLIRDVNLEAVGKYYRDFHPVEDEEAKQILREAIDN